jgi:hypothetical protein
VVVVLFTKLAPREGQPLLRGLEPMITTHWPVNHGRSRSKPAEAWITGKSKNLPHQRGVF